MRHGKGRDGEARKAVEEEVEENRQTQRSSTLSERRQKNTGRLGSRQKLVPREKI